jgi:metal-dependent amidase/aminoacylase/carboxypeptidase family protein
MISEAQIAALIELRHTLHQFPDLSNQEGKTAERIVTELRRLQPDELLQGIGGAGVAAVFYGELTGPTTLLRAELDALPIEESKTFSHPSARAGVSHKCGHDGHMTILIAVAEQLAVKRPWTGRGVL